MVTAQTVFPGVGSGALAASAPKLRFAVCGGADILALKARGATGGGGFSRLAGSEFSFASVYFAQESESPYNVA